MLLSDCAKKRYVLAVNREIMMCGSGNHSKDEMERNHMQGHSGSNENSQIVNDSAIAILKERYAKGEINREEYFKIRADILGEGKE